jgi:hypothetical protein
VFQVAGWPASAAAQEEADLEADQLAVASSPQELSVSSPLAQLLATAAGGPAAPILPLAPQHFRQAVRPTVWKNSKTVPNVVVVWNQTLASDSDLSWRRGPAAGGGGGGVDKGHFTRRPLYFKKINKAAAC